MRPLSRPFVAVLIRRALQFGAGIRASDFWKLPCELLYVGVQKTAFKPEGRIRMFMWPSGAPTWMIGRLSKST